MNFELACLEDFNEIENLYWDLIDKSKEEPSFPDWEKGVHPSADFLMAGIVQKEYLIKIILGILPLLQLDIPSSLFQSQIDTVGMICKHFCSLGE